MNLVGTINRIKGVLHLLNIESRQVLLSNPGIGPKRVEKILALRSDCMKDGGTMSLRDAMDARAITPSLLAKLTGDENVPFVMKYAELYCQCFHDINQVPRVLLSLDLGIHNAAYVLMDTDYTIVEWRRLDLGMPSPYNPEECFRKVKESLGQFPPADLYVIEEQSHRNPANRGFLNISVQLRVLEAMVLAISKLTQSFPVHSLSPNRVSRYFGTNGKSGAAKKKMSTEFATKMIDTLDPMETPLGNTIKVPQDLVEYFKEEKKKDDLSDCLLQAVAVIDWYKMTQKLQL